MFPLEWITSLQFIVDMLLRPFEPICKTWVVVDQQRLLMVWMCLRLSEKCSVALMSSINGVQLKWCRRFRSWSNMMRRMLFAGLGFPRFAVVLHNWGVHQDWSNHLCQLLPDVELADSFYKGIQLVLCYERFVSGQKAVCGDVYSVVNHDSQELLFDCAGNLCTLQVEECFHGPLCIFPDDLHCLHRVCVTP